MFFGRVFFQAEFKQELVVDFFDRLSKIYDNVELEWRYKRYQVSDPKDATAVKLKVGGKTLFVHNKLNNKGLISLGKVKDKEKEVLDAFIKSGYKIEEAQAGNSNMLLVFYFVLMAFLMMVNIDQNVFILYFILPLIFVGGLITYFYTMSIKRLIDSGLKPIYITSILLLICFLLTAPASILIVPYITRLNEKASYHLLTSIK